jgi:probable phosphoglycerate mutase
VTAGRVVCWRHGRTGHNHGGIWQGQLDIPLDAVGHAQAREAAAVIATSLTPGEPLAVISSDLVRASVTAAALAALTGADVQLDARLREVNAGRWQGMTRVEIAEAGCVTTSPGSDDVPVGGGERRSEVARRGAAALREQAAALDGGTLVVVSHGGLLRGAILDVLGLPGQRWDVLGGLGNAHWAELIPDRPAWRLRAYNVQATPVPNRFGAAPPVGDRLTEPHR